MTRPNKILALEMWDAGVPGPQIATECGYAGAKGVFQLIRRKRKAGARIPLRPRGYSRLGARCWRYLRAIELRLKLRLTETQIAERLCITVFGVRNHIQRAKRRGEFNLAFVQRMGFQKADAP